MSFLFQNNINTTLASAVTSGATTITLVSSAGLPSSIASNEYLVVTLNDAATRQNFEIMYATAVSGATLTVIRGQEGTTALAWNTGDFVFSGPTTGQMAALQQVFSGGAGTLSSSTSLGVGYANTYWNVASVTTQTLPAASTVSGQTFGFFATAACTIAIAVSGGTFQGGGLAGSTSVSLTAQQWLIVQSDGSNYRAISASPSLIAPTGTPFGVTVSQVAVSSISATTTSFIAPCNGRLMCRGVTGTTNSSIALTTITMTASLAGLTTQFSYTPGITDMIEAYLPMTMGQSTTVTLSSTAAGVTNMFSCISAFFVPTP